MNAAAAKAAMSAAPRRSFESDRYQASDAIAPDAQNE
jgi:hypothetical protein